MSEKVSSKTPKEIKTGEQIFDSIDNCFSRNVSNSFNPNKEEYLKYEKELAMLNNQKWIEVEGLVAELFELRRIQKTSLQCLEQTSVNTLQKAAIAMCESKIEVYDKVLVLLDVKELSDEFMETLRKSQLDKKAGRVRSYKKIAEECGLGKEQKKKRLSVIEAAANLQKVIDKEQKCYSCSPCFHENQSECRVNNPKEQKKETE